MKFRHEEGKIVPKGEEGPGPGHYSLSGCTRPRSAAFTFGCSRPQSAALTSWCVNCTCSLAVLGGAEQMGQYLHCCQHYTCGFQPRSASAGVTFIDSAKLHMLIIS